MSKCLLATESLVEHYEDRNRERFTNADMALRLALASVDKAITKSETAYDKRFEGLNELRGAMQDQTAQLMTRTEYNAKHEALSSLIASMGERFISMESRIKGRSEGIGVIGTIVLGSITAISFLTTIGVALFGLFHH